MRNIFMKRIDDLLIRYYKELDFEDFFRETPSGPEDKKFWAEAYRQTAFNLIGMMRELSLISEQEHRLLEDVYGEYFSIHQC